MLAHAAPLCLSQFRYNEACPSAVIQTYGPVFVNVLMLQGLAMSAMRFVEGTRRGGACVAHTKGCMLRRAPQQVFVGGAGIQLALADRYAEVRWHDQQGVA